MDRIIDRQKVEKRRKMTRVTDRGFSDSPVGVRGPGKGSGFRTPFFMLYARQKAKPRGSGREREESPLDSGGSIAALLGEPKKASLLRRAETTIRADRAQLPSSMVERRADRAAAHPRGIVFAPPETPASGLRVLLERVRAFAKGLKATHFAAAFAALTTGAIVLLFIASNPYPLPDGGLLVPRDNLDTEMFAFIAPRDAIDEDAAPFIPAILAVREYTVQPGDSLLKIAKDAGISIDSIISLNGMTNAKRIYAGAKLTLPNMSGILHKVKRGDSLESVAKAYSVEIVAIADANDLQSTDLDVGQTLFIPNARLAASELKRALGELMIWPLSGRLTSGFGYRLSPFTGIRQFHNGVDLAVPSGTPVACAMDGTVADIGYNNAFGNYVIVTHADGYQTWYAHLSKTSVKKGQRITQGQRVGLSGNSGFSTGPHLHFAVFKNGKAVDPFRVLK
jgi:murein DD-endopeptidase MepM/ murein hydrolase activator NlpD